MWCKIAKLGGGELRFLERQFRNVSDLLDYRLIDKWQLHETLYHSFD